jgi:hypothetical protein
MSNGSSFDAFMALELREGFLGLEGGEWYEDSLFEIDQSEFNEWHKGFLREIAGAADFLPGSHGKAHH